MGIQFSLLELPLEERLPTVTPAEALMLPSLLHEKDPVSFFVLGEFLHWSLQTEDNGSAPFFLKAGQQILHILNEGSEKGEALLVYKQLRDYMYNRFLRYLDTAPEGCSRLSPMGHAQYDAWSKNASVAYGVGPLTQRGFSRRK